MSSDVLTKMENPLSVLSTTISLLKNLGETMGKYQRSKKTRDRLFTALSSEIEVYLNNFEDLENVARTLLPLLESVADTLTSHQINAIVECASDIQVICSGILEAFVELAKGCSQISSKTAFMEHLKESSAVLHDFVLTMSKLVVRRDSIKIDDDFFRFFKLYEDEIFEEVESEDIDKTVEEMSIYVDIVNKKVKPSIRMSSINRRVRRKFIKSLQEVKKASKKVKIQKVVLINPRHYVPSKLLPYIILIEETYPLENLD